MNDREKDERDLIVRTAMTWMGTPFYMNAELKGVGCDCATFLTCVFHEAGLIEKVKMPRIPRDFHLHRRDEVYAEWLSKYCVRVDREELPGDIVTFQYGRLKEAHTSLVVSWPKVIHSMFEVGVVTADASDPVLAERRFGHWSYWR